MKALAVISTVSSLMANVVSCTVTHPLDIIRTRYLFKFYNTDQSQHYTGIMNGINKIYANDGFPGFFKGLSIRIVRKGLGSIICWTLYEFLIDKNEIKLNIGA